MKVLATMLGGALLFVVSVIGFNLGLRWMGEPNTLQAFAGFAIVIGLLTMAGLVLARLVARHLGPLLLLMIVVWAGGCTRVDPGHVGIQVNYYGTDRGVESYPRVTGMVWYNPISTTVFSYPTFVQTAVWTKNPNEGDSSCDKCNEEITFTNLDQMQVSADISLSYHLVGERVPAFYVKFRSDDLHGFTHGFLRNLARDAFNEHAGRYSISQIMGDNSAFITDVRTALQAQLTPIGVTLDQFGFIGAPRPPQAVIEAINAKVHATQLAQQKTNELVQAQADANKAVAQTEGYARSVTIRADAEAAANVKIANSLTATLVQYKALEKWDGKLPQVSGTVTPFINLQKP